MNVADKTRSSTDAGRQRAAARPPAAPAPAPSTGAGPRARVAGVVDAAAAAVRWLRARDRLALVAAVLVLVPCVVAVATALREPWVPSTDWGRIELATRDVGTADTPLVGAYSRFPWSHPGPLMFYVMALPYRLVPAEHGMLFAAAVVNLTFAAAYVLVALRHPRNRALVALAVLAVFERGVGVGDLADPWNPTIALVPLALYLLLCIEIAEGRRSWPLPVAVGVGCFLAQSHAGLLPVVVLVGAAAVALRAWRARTEPEGSAPEPARPLPARAWGGAAALGLVLWIPPLVDQVAGEGNLGRLARYGLGMDDGPTRAIEEGALSPGEVLSTASWLLDPLGPWVGSVDAQWLWGFPLLGEASPVWLVLTLAVVAAVLAGSRPRSRAPSQLRPGRDPEPGGAHAALSAGLVALAGVVAVVVGMFTLRGVPFFYLGRWSAAVVMAVWLAAGWGAVAVVERRWPVPASGPLRSGARGHRVGGMALVGAAGLVVVATVADGSVGEQPVQAHSDAYRRIEGQVVRLAREEEPVVTTLDRRVLVNNDVNFGLVVLLERHGIEWIDVRDPRARGRDLFLVSTLDRVGVVDTYGGVLEAASADPAGRATPEDELMLTRTPVDWVLPE